MMENTANSDTFIDATKLQTLIYFLNETQTYVVKIIPTI